VRRLIINADDFGLTAGVNRAIAELFKSRVLTSTTLMARASATARAVQIARDETALGVGCHVVLVDGDPVMPTAEIPTLVDPRTGRFVRTLGAFLRRLISRRIRAEEIQIEAAAQIALLQAKGLALTHFDTHKHIHLFPAVLRPVLHAARKAGIQAVRNPFEPAWSLRATPGASWIRRAEVGLAGRFEPVFRRIVGEEDFVTTNGAIGVLATGTLDGATLSSLLRNLPPGDWELVTHPGYHDADLAQAHTRLLTSRETEREALLALRELAQIKLISFADLHRGEESHL
jgi:predicted glycoside hydrolase/deacetylase ChbG (UPF0249 family)